MELLKQIVVMKGRQGFPILNYNKKGYVAGLGGYN